MKKCIVLLFVLIGLAGCIDQGKLVRVDFQMSENPSGEGMVIEENQLKIIDSMFRKIKWENAKVQMGRKEDVALTFFYRYNPNEPERLEDYQIWFNNDMVTEIVDQNRHRYGKLDEEDAVKLKEAINKQTVNP
jgi:hypothetical protein